MRVSPKQLVPLPVRDFVRTRAKHFAYNHTYRRIYLRAAREPVDERKAVFVDATSLSMPSSMQLMWDELESRGFTCEFVSLHMNCGRFSEYSRQSEKMAAMVATARLVVLCDMCVPLGVLPLRQETHVVQLWHACGAFKKFGLSTAEKIFGNTRAEQTKYSGYGNTSLVTVSSPEVVWAYEEAMGLEGTGAVRALGVSRTDAFFDGARLEAWREQAEAAVPAIAGRRALLWAPTFRGQVAEARAPQTLDVAELRDALGDGWVLLVKHHPLVRERPAVPKGCGGFVFDVTDSLPIEAAMAASDACVTDYSSLVFEYSLLGRPMAFLVPDIGEYDDWRGFYYDFDAFAPGPVLSTTAELAGWARSLEPGACPPEVSAFRGRFMSACDGRATARIADAALALPAGQRGQSPVYRGQSPAYRAEVSVVVPVYNAEACLSRCVASLDAQTASQESFEVILINDGSTDGSLELCRSIARERLNYVVLDQPNQGVSAARNAGIRASRGRYIMFLDSDDWVSKHTIEALASTFDRYASEVDLVALGVTYEVEETGATWRHKRDRWLTRTGVYPLDEYPYVAQSTTSVCIKNEGDATPLFPTTMRMGEDQYFNAKLLARRNVLGYCAEATYHYVSHDKSSTSKWDIPKYAFEDMLRLYHFLLEPVTGEGEPADNPSPSSSPWPYGCALILYNMGWRLRKGVLYPEFGDAATRKKNHERLYQVLRAIPKTHWEQSPYLSNQQRLELMQRAGIVGTPTSALHATDVTYVSFDQGGVVRFGRPAIAITWALRTRDVLRIRGIVYGPFLQVGNELELDWNCPGGPVRAQTRRVQVCCEEEGARIRDAWWFAADLPAMGLRPYVARPHATLDGAAVPAFDLRFDLCRTNSRRIHRHARAFGALPLEAAGTSLRVGTLKGLPTSAMPAVVPLMRGRDQKRTGYADIAQIKTLRAALPRAMRPFAKRRTWLYVHAPQALERDRALTDGIQRLDLADLEGVVPKLAALLAAERLISSDRDLSDLLPCDYATWDSVADLTRADQAYVLVAPAGETPDLAGTPYDCLDADSAAPAPTTPEAPATPEPPASAEPAPTPDY